MPQLAVVRLVLLVLAAAQVTAVDPEAVADHVLVPAAILVADQELLVVVILVADQDRVAGLELAVDLELVVGPELAVDLELVVGPELAVDLELVVSPDLVVDVEWVASQVFVANLKLAHGCDQGADSVQVGVDLPAVVVLFDPELLMGRELAAELVAELGHHLAEVVPQEMEGDCLQIIVFELLVCLPHVSVTFGFPVAAARRDWCR